MSRANKNVTMHLRLVTDSFKKGIKEAQSEINKFSQKSINELKKDIDSYERKLQQLSKRRYKNENSPWAARNRNEISKLTTNLNNARNSLKGVESGANKAGQAMLTGLAAGAVTGGIYLIAQALFEVTQAIEAFISESIQVSIRFDAITNKFKAASGSMKDGAESFKFIKTLTDKMGLSLLETSDAFSLFQASALRSNIGMNTTKQIFEDISTAVVSLQLGAERTGLIFRALEQIAAKSIVQLEELKLQLGDSLPGAVTIAARSVDMTTAAFRKAISEGKIMANDFLPRFAEQIREELGGSAKDAAEMARAEFSRFDNTVLELKDSLGDLINDALIPLARFMSPIIKSFSEWAKNVKTLNAEIYNMNYEDALHRQKVLLKEIAEFEQRRGDLSKFKDNPITSMKASSGRIVSGQQLAREKQELDRRIEFLETVDKRNALTNYNQIGADYSFSASKKADTALDSIEADRVGYEKRISARKEFEESSYSRDRIFRKKYLDIAQEFAKKEYKIKNELNEQLSGNKEKLQLDTYGVMTSIVREYSSDVKKDLNELNEWKKNGYREDVVAKLSLDKFGMEAALSRKIAHIEEIKSLEKIHFKEIDELKDKTVKASTEKTELEYRKMHERIRRYRYDMFRDQKKLFDEMLESHMDGLEKVYSRLTEMSYAMLKELGEQVVSATNGITRSIASNLDNLISGTKSVKSVFEQLSDDLTSIIRKMITQMIAEFIKLKVIQPYMNQIFGVGLNNAPTLTNQVGGMVLNGVGESSMNQVKLPPLKTGSLSGLGNLFGKLGSFVGGFFADGGRPPIGIPSIVGERGPELFVPDSAGTILPNKMLGGSKQSPTYVYAPNIQTGASAQEVFNVLEKHKNQFFGMIGEGISGNTGLRTSIKGVR